MDSPRIARSLSKLHLLTAALTLLSACGDAPPADPYVGNMNDFSYGNQVTPEKTVARINASGRKVAVSEFEGRFIWADYAAPWCQPCATQAAELKKIVREVGEDVVFLTVMTADQGGYGDLPTETTAVNWASRHGLNPDHVVAATDRNLSGWTIPTHILYSPKGQSLYRSTGVLPAEKMKTILFSRMNQWEKWNETGETQDWMWYGE